VVDSAKLELYCNYVNSSKNQYPAVIDLHKMLVPWDEGNAIGTVDTANWNYRQNNSNWGAPGAQAGVDYASSAASSFTITGNSILNSWLSWDVQTVVSDWLATPSSNHGVMLKLTDDLNSVYKYFKFPSADYTTDPSLRPKLTITYTTDNFTTVYYIRDASGQVIATYER